MRITSVAVVAVIALVLTAGAAAGMPGSAPDAAGDAADDAQADGHDDAADAERADEDAEDEDAKDDEAADEAMNRSENAAAAGPDNRDDARGPAVDLPGQVPDHVHEIHSLIDQYVSGALDGTLGEQVSSVDTGEESADDGSTEDGAGNASAATPVP